MTLTRLVAAALAAAALAQLAHAEGGLPGAPAAVNENAPRRSLSQSAASTEQPAAAEDPGGAVFSPFAAPATTPVPRPGPAEGASESRAADDAVAFLLATMSIAAIGWLLIRSL